MIGDRLEAQIEAAAEYERLFVPAEFREWAPRLLDAAGVTEGQRVLDVACGTGALARQAVARVGATGTVVGLDPDPGMLAVAAQVTPSIEWRQGRAESLPYPHGTFDAVTCQFGLMFFSDRRGGLREMWRVLTPGGRLVVSTWGTLEDTPAYSRLVEVLECTHAGAADALRTPFSLGDVAELRSLFSSAGVDDVTIDTVVGSARFPDTGAMVNAELKGWLPRTGLELTEDQYSRVLEEAALALRPFVAPDGCVTFESPAHIVTARRPAGDQAAS